MAKIVSVTLEKVPDEIRIDDNLSDITVRCSIDFHDLDISMRMAYCLHYYVYDIHGSIDIPVIISNWDESNIQRISRDRNDDFLGKHVEFISADSKSKELVTTISLRLGAQTLSSSSYSRKLEVFCTLIPAVERASKWSKPFESRIVF